MDSRPADTSSRSRRPQKLRTDRRSKRGTSPRSGFALVMVLVLLVAVFGILALVIDGGYMVADSSNLQHVADCGATAAATEIRLGHSNASAIAAANEYVKVRNDMADVTVTVNIPPSEGPYAGNSNYVETVLEQERNNFFIGLVGGSQTSTIYARAVAGTEPSTGGAAIVVLDPDPSALSIPGIPLVLPAYPTLIGGMEVLGVGQLRVQGAVLVNTEWGGVDQDGNPAGTSAGPPYAIACTPLLSLSTLLATDIRVVGGVDNPENYGHVDPGEASPLEANRLPVPDPFNGLPAPTTSVDGANVYSDLRGSVDVTGLPILSPPVTLDPGVYEWININSGTVIMNPGVYIIRSIEPMSQRALSILGGEVSANGVMFYITNSAGYSADLGSPDSSDGESAPAAPSSSTIPPSVVINTALLNSQIAPLNDPNSPFHGMLIYQRRRDRRPIVLVQQGLLLGGQFSGTIYAKWGHVLTISQGTLDTRIVAGTVRFVTVLDTTIAPSSLLPPAQDVFLVQ